MATFAAHLSPLENNLTQGLRHSEEGAFKDLFHHFGQKIYRTALKILKEEESAKDAVQETMINIHRAVDTFRGEAKLATWINRITVNVCLEMIRRNKKHSNRLDDDISEQVTLRDRSVNSPFQIVQQQEVQDRVRTALSNLNRKHEEVVRMHDLEGYTIREIAEIVGVAEGTIKSRLFYGREELKKRLAA